MLVNGVDLMGGTGGLASATHDQKDVDFTANALRQSVRALKAEREIRGM
jgi:glutamate-1-semialdehyde 2,1-aminomutase